MNEKTDLTVCLRRFASLLAIVVCAACSADDPRDELLAIAAAKDPGQRSRAITACLYDSVVERHGSETARQIVEMARARARGEALPADARALLAISLQESARCAERMRQLSGARPRETRIRRGAHS